MLKATAVLSPLPAGDVVDSSLSSLSLAGGRGGPAGGEGLGEGEGAGDISSTLPYTALPHGAYPKGTSHNEDMRSSGRRHGTQGSRLRSTSVFAKEV